MVKTFKRMYADAVKAKAIKQLTPAFVAWEKSGQQIIGCFISRNEVTGTLGGKAYYQYLFDTDEGRVKFSLGSSADGEVGATLVPGQVYGVTYKGKEKIKGGRQVNRFNVEELGAADELGNLGEGDVEEEASKSKA